MASVARTKLDAREPAPTPSPDRGRADRPELARQVGMLAEANARLDARARALDERSRLLLAALETIDQGVSVYDQDQRLVAWSRGFLSDIGGRPEPLAGEGTRLSDVLRAMAHAGGGTGPADAPLPHHVERIATTERAVRERRLWPDGRIVELACLPLPEGGRVLVTSDVTERAGATAERQRVQRELEQFVARAAHDLQAPLRTMLGQCETLARRAADEVDARSGLAHAIDAGRRMQRLIEDLLAYARTGLDEPVIRPLALDEALDAALGNLRAKLRETDALIERDALPTVPADPLQMVRLCQNLIDNALSFRGAGRRPRVHISAARDGAFWRLACADNGIGIDPRQAGRLFQAFAPGHGPAEATGSGLGLAICQHIVAGHGGRIWLDSDYRAGTRFCFTLPDPATA